jgi:CheY-like chemotaxis protein
MAIVVSATSKLGTMLVEDHSTFRGILAFLLEREPDFEVLAQAGSLAEAREALGRQSVDRGIDLAVVDLALPDGKGTDLIEELRRSSPGVRIVVLSAMVGGHEVRGGPGGGCRRGAGEGKVLLDHRRGVEALGRPSVRATRTRGAQLRTSEKTLPCTSVNSGKKRIGT